MASPAGASSVIRFGPFELNVANGELRKAGVPLKIHPQPLRVLLLLIEHSGQTVTREEIQHSLWGDNTFVDFERGINFCINQVRAALGDDAEKPRYVETLPRRGYRFIAPIAASGVEEHVSERFNSIAVLPLVNASGDPDMEYLSDGISESLINLLSQFPSLRVIPRTSAFRYKGREADLKAVGRDLKVRTVLTGKVIQWGDRLVVQAELVDVANDAQLWGGQVSRELEDVFEVQEEVARQISENLRLRLTPEDEKRLTKRSTQNREAYQFLLKAQYHTNKMTPEGYQRGMDYARQAIETDPGYADAYVWVAAVYSGLGALGFLRPVEAFPKAKAAVLKALEIDESLAEAHAFLAAVRLFYDWDWSGAEHACKRAIELNPNYAAVHAVLSDWLFITGRQQEAMAENQLAVELDPLSASLNFNFGQKLLWNGNHERAIEQLKKALEFDPDFAWTYIGLAQAYAWRGMYAESLATCEKVATLFEGNPHSRALRSLVLAIAGKADGAKTILNELNERPKLDPLALIYSAESCSVLGEKDKAFQFLEAAYQDRVSLLIYLGVRPTFNNIRSDPRFADLLRRMGLPHVPLPHAG
jgi:TolB-like protein/Tfp pilus assembly protein PilF